jgi:hypothetical protein
VPLRSSSLVLILTTLAVAAAASGAQPRLQAPGLVHQGDTATFRIPVTGAPSCALAIRYANGTTQRAGSRAVESHSASWVVAIPKAAAIGVARWTAACGKTVRRGGTFAVVRVRSTTPGGPADAPKVVIDKQGYTQRPDRYGTGSLVSYGLMLRNSSAAEDATGVYVLVNMVDASGALLGTVSTTVPLIGAAGTFAYGNSLELRTQAAVDHLEITIRIAAHAPKTAHLMPEFSNVRPEASQFDTGWIGEVDGEVVNTATAMTLQNATLSIVVFDAAGNVIGGGTGATFISVPSGARVVFTAASGFTALPADKAATAAVSAVPTYTPGT